MFFKVNYVNCYHNHCFKKLKKDECNSYYFLISFARLSYPPIEIRIEATRLSMYVACHFIIRAGLPYY
jgi:hypothetical protein